MAAADDLTIRLRLEMQQFMSEMAKMPDISDKELKKLGKRHEKALRKIERDSAKAAKNSRKDWDRNLDKMGGAAERTASLMGGVFGDISDSVIDLGGRFSDLAGGMGGTTGALVGLTGGVAAFAAAAGFATHALMEWMEGADDLIDHLERVNGIPPLSPEHSAALERYQEAAADAEAMSAHMSLTLMAQFAPALTDVQHAVIGLSDAMASLTGEGWNLADAITGQARRMMEAGPATWALVKAYDYFSARGEVVAQTIETIDEEMDDAKESTLEWADAIKQSESDIANMAAILGYDASPAVVDLDARQKAAAAAAKEHAAMMREAERASAALASTGDRAADALERQEEAFADVLVRVQEYQQEINEAVDVSSEAVEATAALQEAQVSLKEALADYWLTFAETAEESIGLVTGLMTDLTTMQLDALEAQSEERQKQFKAGVDERNAERERLDLALERGEITAQQHAQRMTELQVEGREARKQNAQSRKEEQKAALKAFRAGQAAAISEAIMQAAVNALKLTGFFSYLGPGAPAAAWGVAGAQLAVQMKAIKSQKPPEFPTGGMVQGGQRAPGMTPDHFLIGAQTGEAVLSRQGVAALGGAQGVEAANRGAGMGGATIVTLDGAVLGAAMSKTMRRPSFGRELDRRTGTLPGIRED